MEGLKTAFWFIVIMFGIVFVTAIITTIVNNADTAKENRLKRKTVWKTRFIDSSHTATSSSRIRTGSAVARGLVGGALLGPVGAVAGAATGRQRTTVNEHHTTTFMVYYIDGSHRVETVENTTERYRIYMSKLEMD